MKTKGHLTLIRCDQLPDPEEPAKQSSVLDSQSIYFRDDRVTIHDFTTKCGPRTPRTTTPTALVTVCGSASGGMTVSAEIDHDALTKLRDAITKVLEHYEQTWAKRGER